MSLAQYVNNSMWCVLNTHICEDDTHLGLNKIHIFTNILCYTAFMYCTLYINMISPSVYMNNTAHRLLYIKTYTAHRKNLVTKQVRHILKYEFTTQVLLLVRFYTSFVMSAISVCSANMLAWFLFYIRIYVYVVDIIILEESCALRRCASALLDATHSR